MTQLFDEEEIKFDLLSLIEFFLRMFDLEFSWGEGGREWPAMVSSPKWLLFFKAKPIHFVTMESDMSALFLPRYLFDISILKLSSIYCEDGQSYLHGNLVISVYETSSARKCQRTFII
jgi:hypothetical protein